MTSMTTISCAGTPVGRTGQLDRLRSQQFRVQGLRSQLALGTMLRSLSHPCQLAHR